MLIVGDVSSNLRSHSVAYFLRTLLTHHDRSRFELFAYNNTMQHDNDTELLKEEFDEWRDIQRVSDLKVAQRIADDRIDILVDLIAHTAGGRLGVFALQPAAIQVTWLAYPNTTGLNEIQYRIIDSIADPEGMTERYYTEKLCRLPSGFLCYEFPSKIDYSRDLPCQRKGYFTFGSFNNLSKIREDNIEAWALILQGVPLARIMIKAHQLVDEGVRNYYLKLFESHGIDKERVDLRAAVKGKDRHLKMYDEVDLALDSFPYNGTTTTCEALWMGVPTVTFRGEVHAARVSASILHFAGMNEFVAEDLEGYVQKAIAIGNSPDQLVELRSNLRERVEASALGDAAGFTRQMEGAFESMFLEGRGI